MVSDSEEVPETADIPQPQAQPATKKGKLRKSAPGQPESGSAKKRRKRSISNTPEPADALQQQPAESSKSPSQVGCTVLGDE